MDRMMQGRIAIRPCKKICPIMILICPNGIMNLYGKFVHPLWSPTMTWIPFPRSKHWTIVRGYKPALITKINKKNPWPEKYIFMRHCKFWCMYLFIPMADIWLLTYLLDLYLIIKPILSRLGDNRYGLLHLFFIVDNARGQTSMGFPIGSGRCGYIIIMQVFYNLYRRITIHIKTDYPEESFEIIVWEEAGSEDAPKAGSAPKSRPVCLINSFRLMIIRFIWWMIV